MCACPPAHTPMHAYLLHVCNNCVRMPLHVHSTSVSVHMQTCVCVCIRLCVHPNTHVGVDVCTQACVRVPTALWLRLHPGVHGAPRAACPPRLGGKGATGRWGAWGGGTAALRAAWTPPFYPPSPPSGLGSAASGCARVINHVAGVHARTHGRRRSWGLLPTPRFSPAPTRRALPPPQPPWRCLPAFPPFLFIPSLLRAASWYRGGGVVRRSCSGAASLNLLP